VPRDVVALVSADDFVSAIRVYADRVNDLLRRGGISATEAVEVSEAQALALLNALIDAPATVIDLAGWWFGRAIEATAAVGEPASPVTGTGGAAAQDRARAALAELPDDERWAVALRDSYDLPLQAVGVAMGRDPQSAAELTAAGRLHLVAAYDSRPAPDLSGHTGRTTVDLVALSRLADGTLESPWAAPLRRHAANCPACEDVLESLARGRRLAAGLAIIAMADDAREALIDRVAGRAAVMLPTAEAVQQALDDDDEPGPPISPVVAVVVLVLALALGVAIAVLSRANHTSSPGPIPTIAPSIASSSSPPPTTAVQIPSAPASPTASDRRTPHRHHSPSPTPTHSVTAPATGPQGPSISLSPSHGPSGSTITVAGSGWRAGTTVTLTYGHTGSTARATVDSRGRFVATVTATAVLPGAEEITARDGAKSADARFSQTI
jgi:DNA-directed RNA polymerase specialized sigma24 family protein